MQSVNSTLRDVLHTLLNLQIKHPNDPILRRFFQA